MSPSPLSRPSRERAPPLPPILVRFPRAFFGVCCGGGCWCWWGWLYARPYARGYAQPYARGYAESYAGPYAQGYAQCHAGGLWVG